MSGFAVSDYRIDRGGEKIELAEHFVEAVNIGGREDKQVSDVRDYSGFSIDRGGDVNKFVNHPRQAGGDHGDQREPKGAGYSYQVGFSVEVVGDNKHVEDSSFGQESGEGRNVRREEEAYGDGAASHRVVEEENESTSSEESDSDSDSDSDSCSDFCSCIYNCFGGD